MITLDDYFGKNKVNVKIYKEATILLLKVVTFLKVYGEPIKMTSGYRSPEHNKKVGGARSSKHMSGQAIDMYDPDKKLAKFCLERKDLLEEYGLYCEDMRCTRNWVHFQSIPPGSGKRFFIPSLAWAKKLSGPLTVESL